jgi:hypothetical protein
VKHEVRLHYSFILEIPFQKMLRRWLRRILRLWGLLSIISQKGGEQINSSCASCVTDSKTKMTYLIKRLLPFGEDKREMVLVSTLVFGAIFKIRAYMKKSDCSSLTSFIQAANSVFREIELDPYKLNQ